MKKILIFLFLVLTIQGYSQQWFRSYDLGKLGTVQRDYGISSDSTTYVFHISSTRGKSASKNRLVGVLYSINNSTPTYPQDTWTSLQLGQTEGQINVNYLIPNNHYYFRTFVINNVGLNYGDSWTYDTPGSTNFYAPTVQTAASETEIGAEYAYWGGGVTDDGGITPTDFGVCWDTSVNPTINDNSNQAFSGNYTSFVGAATGLSPSTTYHLRAYAVNTIRTGYGSDVSFTTDALGGSDPPSVVYISTTDIQHTQAYCTGEVTSIGSSSVTVRGFCWGTSVNPDIEDNVVSCGSGISTFSCYASGLSSNTMYHVRAFASNSFGTSYSNDITFTTLCTATVTTASATNIGGTSATLSGNLISENGHSVTSRGVCWSTSTNPTTANDYLTNGSGTGSYQVNAASLTEGTKYYARAFAVNSCGTEYGNQIEFTTLLDNNCDKDYFIFYNSMNSSCGIYDFYGSLASQACDEYTNISCGAGLGGNKSMFGVIYRAESVTVGEQLYNYTSPCNIVTDSGYFIYFPNPTVSVLKIVHVVSGVIDSITQCYP